MTIDDKFRKEVDSAMHAALIKCMTSFDKEIIGMLYSHFKKEKLQCGMKVCECIAEFNQYPIARLKKDHPQNSKKVELIRGYMRWDINQHPLRKYKTK